MNASGQGRSRGRGVRGTTSPEAEAFLSKPMPATKSPGTLSLNHVYFLNSNNNKLTPQRPIHDLNKMGGFFVHILMMSAFNVFGRNLKHQTPRPGMSVNIVSHV